MTALLLALVVGNVATADDGPAAPDFVNLAPGELTFQPAPGLPGASYAVLFGDPSAPGTYVMRYRIPAGQLVPPRFRDRFVPALRGHGAHAGRIVRVSSQRRGALRRFLHRCADRGTGDRRGAGGHLFRGRRVMEDGTLER